MKLITLNSHSLIEEHYEEKLSRFIQGILAERPDLLALQEVNQDMTATEVPLWELKETGFHPVPSSAVPIRRMNHGLRCAKELARLGFPLHWTWVSAKTGYDRFDEGLAFFSPYPIRSAEAFFLTNSQNYQNWRTRKGLLAAFETPWGLQYACSLHMGRWEDEEEPFSQQWQRLSSRLSSLKEKQVWLMGDFNAPSSRRGQSLDMILEQGWLDTCRLAGHPQGHPQDNTVEDGIDGWEDRSLGGGMRIDYIFTNHPVSVSSSRVIFHPGSYGTVSDHRAVAVEALLTPSSKQT